MRHPNSERFHRILAELGESHDKNAEEGGDPFVRVSKEWGTLPWISAMMDAHDEMRKIQRLLEDGDHDLASGHILKAASRVVEALVLYELETSGDGQSELERLKAQNADLANRLAEATAKQAPAAASMAAVFGVNGVK